MPNKDRPIAGEATGFAALTLAHEILTVLIEKGLLTKAEANGLLERAAILHDAPSKSGVNADAAKLLRLHKFD